VETQEIDGQIQGQGEYEAPEAGATEGVTSGGEDYKSRYQDLEAKYDMLLDGFEELRSTFLSSRQQAAAQQIPDDDLDDDQPLTPSKVKKIVSSAVGSAVSQSTQKNEQAMWDQKLAQDFPLSDAQFQRELKKTSKEMMSAGLDLKHPRALYECAKIAAKSMGITGRAAKPKTRQTQSEDEHSAEAPSSPGAVRTAIPKVKMVPEDDPRVKFYTSVKGTKDKKAIEKIRVKLAEKDARRKK
jgi:hypothetical protein